MISHKLVKTFNDHSRPAYHTWVAAYDVTIDDRVVRIEVDGMQRKTAMKNAKELIRRLGGRGNE